MTWVNCPFKAIQETHAPGPCHVHEIVSCQGSEKRKMQMNGIIMEVRRERCKWMGLSSQTTISGSLHLSK